MSRTIEIRGAREHNLKGVSLSLPRNKLIVLTGLSGSGKSSLAFDTIYAEGQRRYLESLSAYARQFMEQMSKPALDSIEGLSPAISIEQKNISRNPRSTVGTVTEVYDFMRLLFARVGSPHCPQCGRKIQQQSATQIAEQIREADLGTKFAILAPIVRGKKGEYQKELLDLRSQGYARALIDGEEVSLSFPVKLKRSHKHDISIYIDRLILKPGVEGRLKEALDLAIQLAGGLAEVEFHGEQGTTRKFYSTRFACPECGTSFAELEPRSFSFNSPHGACEQCEGLGVERKIDPNLVIPNPSLSLREGAIAPWLEKSESWLERVFEALESSAKVRTNIPFQDLNAKEKDIILNGTREALEFKVVRKGSEDIFNQSFRGVVPPLEERLEDDEEPDEELLRFAKDFSCSVCHGARLKPEALSVFVGDKNISEVAALNIDRVQSYFAELQLTKNELLIAQPIIKEIAARLNFLQNVGLSYLSLNRSAATLSGGEAQRIRLATQIGASLVGVLYVLDEPSIGLHQRDNEKLIHTLEHLRDIGNTVIVVEHDEETIRRSDYVVDLGPGAGELGGQLVFQGDPKDLERTSEGLTGKYLRGALSVPVPKRRRLIDKSRQILLRNARANNLKGLDVAVPLGLFVCVTGVSGSGKSTLVIDTLLAEASAHLSGQKTQSALLDGIDGLQLLDKIIYVDQSPIGRTPRSNPATYTGVFSDIRALFAQLPDAKARGYKPGRFSFNVEGGRCESCSGDGSIKITMHFLPDVFVPCEVCRGKRYSRETLEVLYRGKSIADVLAMTIEQACAFFERVPQVKSKLQTLLDVGLGYVQVGQSAVTLSGGEAQRIKLSRELNKRATGRTLYIFDEPTTGLHFEDVRRLLQILQLLVDQGNNVLVIEHNLDVIKQADHVIDLGPEGGDRGGEIVFSGTPEELSEIPASWTGRFLKPLLKSK